MAAVGPNTQYGKLRARVNYTALTDEALAAEAKLGDHSAFVELWRRH
jgi:hypothetical protein